MSETTVLSNTPVEDELRLEIIKKQNGYRAAAKSIPFALIEKLNTAVQANKELFNLYNLAITPGIVVAVGSAYANVVLSTKSTVIPRDAIKVLLKVLGGTFKRVEAAWNTADADWNWVPKGKEDHQNDGLRVQICTALPQSCKIEVKEEWLPAGDDTRVDSDGQIMTKITTRKVVCSNDKEVK